MQSNVNQGLEVHGEIQAATAAEISRIPLYTQAANATVTIGAFGYLVLAALAVYLEGAAAEAEIFFDLDGLSDEEPIVAADDVGNTFTVAGDRAAEFAAGRVFEVAGSTANDDTYTSAGAVYDAVNDETTISVASVAGDEADGNITSAPAAQAGSLVWSGADAGDAHVIMTWDTAKNGRRGRAGECLYVDVPADAVMSVVFDGLARMDLVKQGPAGAPIADPT